MKSTTSVDVAGNPLTTNVAIFWVAGTKRAGTGTDGVRRTAGATTPPRSESERKAHWEHIYRSKAPTEVSWFQEHAVLSLDGILRTGVARDAPIIDVGGGTSPLVGDLLDRNFTDLTVLDVSGAALSRTQMRLGARAAAVTWIEADITTVALPAAHYAVWHDRAVFHFLIAPADRRRYIETATAALQPGGHLIIATFAADGPQQCSGLTTTRYSPAELQAEFGAAFELVESAGEVHMTPAGAQQKFTYCHFRKRP